MKWFTVLTCSAMLAAAASASFAADNDSRPAPGNREQMREMCKDNPEACRERMKKRAEEWFKKVDKDGDGSISREEAQANAPRLAKNFDAVDANHDGKVTAEELRAHHKAMQEKRRTEHGDHKEQ